MGFFILRDSESPWLDRISQVLMFCLPIKNGCDHAGHRVGTEIRGKVIMECVIHCKSLYSVQGRCANAPMNHEKKG